MTRKLNFLLMGAPRSGTTALAQAINCHPLAFCGVEAFSINDSHKNISFPRSFDNQLDRIPGANHHLLKQHLETKRATALIIGNKEPRYGLVLPKLLQKSPNLRLIFVYRNPSEFVDSWNRRARDAADETWHQGQRGLFGVLSLFGYLRSLTQIDCNCLVVPYGAFSRDVAGTTTQITRWLGIGEERLPDKAAIEQLQLIANVVSTRAREVLGNEAEFLHAVAIQELDAIFGSTRTFAFSDISRQVLDYVRSLHGRWGQRFVEALVGYEDPYAILYFRKLLRHPSVAAMFAEEAAFSPQLGAYLQALPRALKLRRIFLRQSAIEPCERFIRRVRVSRAA